MEKSKRISNKQKKKIVSPLDDPDMDLWVLLDRTRDVISKAREVELNQYKISRVQSTVLYALLSENRGLTINELSKWNVREPNSVLSLVNRMQKNGLVKKIRNTDNDLINIIVTEKGRKLYMNATRLSIKTTFSILSEEEKQQLYSYLIKLRRQGRELLGMDYKPPIYTLIQTVNVSISNNGTL